jgi:hypothetical protein
MPTPMMKVGDTVMWRGGFGMDPPCQAVIEQINRTEQRRSKRDGESVDQIEWANKDYALVTLTNGSWAYGEQLSPMPGAPT